MPWPLYFYPDPNFALENHVRYLDAKEKFTTAELITELSEMLRYPPSFKRSPWEILVGEVKGEGGVVMMMVVVVVVVALMKDGRFQCISPPSNPFFHFVHLLYYHHYS